MACSSCSQRYINAAARRALPRNVAAKVSLRRGKSVRGIIKNTPDVQQDTPEGVQVNPSQLSPRDPSTGFPVSLIKEGVVAENVLTKSVEKSSGSSDDNDADD